MYYTNDMSHFGTHGIINNISFYKASSFWSPLTSRNVFIQVQNLRIFNRLNSPDTFQETFLILFAPWFLICATSNPCPLTQKGLMFYLFDRDLESKNGTSP